MKEKILAWVRIARLQFYPMTWVAYTLGAITLAGVPDRLADQEVSKRGLAVVFGPRGAFILASFFVSIAA